MSLEQSRSVISGLVNNVTSLPSRYQAKEEEPLDLLSLPTDLQLLVFKKLRCYKTFKNFDQASRATNRLGQIDKRTLFLQKVKGNVNIIDRDSFPHKAHCRPHFKMVSIHTDEEEVVRSLMASQATIRNLVFHNMRMEPALFGECLQKMNVKQVILWDSQANILTSSNLDQLDHLFFNSPISDEMLLTMAPRVPKYLSIAGATLTEEGLESFCQQVIDGERDIGYITISTGYRIRGLELAQRLGARYFVNFKDGIIYGELKVSLENEQTLTIGIYQQRVTVFKWRVSVLPGCVLA